MQPSENNPEEREGSHEPVRSQTSDPGRQVTDAGNTNGDDLLWQHLKSVPAFRALLRAVEARFYRRLELPGPVLDLGCGDGHFARMALPDRKLDVGADPWWNPLQKSQRQQTYGAVVQSLGDALPFPAHTFSSAISNSVLEHIPNVQAVLNDTNRVLRPGGKLVITMPSDLFTENLYGARYLGDSYRRFFNRISRHAHTESPEWWAERLAWAGFRISRWQYYFSESALHALELGHVQGLPAAIMHFLTGHWIVAPWEQSLRPTERWLRPYFEEPFPDEGAYLFIVAEKAAEGRIHASLPPPRPFTLEELAEPIDELSPVIVAQAVGWGEGVDEEAPLPVPASPIEDEADRFVEQTLADELQEPSPEEEESAPRRSMLIVLGLAFVAFAAAFIGLGALNADPAAPTNGLFIYGLAVLAFAGLVLYVRRGGPSLRWPNLAELPRRRWWYLVALFLSLAAYWLAGSTPYEGAGVPALFLWLTASGVALYALWGGAEAVQPGVIADATSETPPVGATSGQPELVIPEPYPWLVGALFFLAALLIRGISLTSHPFVLNGVEASLGLDAVAVGNGLIRNPFAVGWLTNPTLPAYLLLIPLRLFGQTILGVRILSVLVGSLTVALLYLLGRRVWGETVALIAAILLAGAHVHVHYSRLGMNNVWDALLIFVSVALVVLAVRQGRRRNWLAAAVATGAGFYFYMSSHLLPLILLGALVYLLVTSRSRLRQQSRHILAAAALILIIILPQWLFYNSNAGVFLQRAENVGILQSGWLAQETVKTGRTALDLYSEQFWRSVLAFQAGADTATTYNPGIPLLRFIPALLFTFGLGLALVRWRRFAWAILLIWLTVTLLFAGFLLISPPDSHRLLGVMPAVCLIAAAPLAWLARLLEPRLSGDSRSRKSTLLAILSVVAVLLSAGDLFFYFGSYRAEGRFGDRNTEIAYGIASYLDALEGEHTAYLYGPPAVYVDFPTIPFLATDFVVNANLFNVDAPGAPLAEPLLKDSDLVFFFLPERLEEATQIETQYPDGERITIEGTHANPLFVVYRVEQ